jgi:dienelactone hydrolase
MNVREQTRLLAQRAPVFAAGLKRLSAKLLADLRQAGRARDPTYLPSSFHNRLAAEIDPALSYRGQVVGTWQADLRSVLEQLLGEAPTELALGVDTLWKRDFELGSIEKLVLRTQPGASMPAYLCVPHRGTPPYPLFICLQGHTTGMHNSIGVSRWDERTPIHVPGDRDLARQCLARGIAALCIEQRALGERSEQANPWQQLAWHECTEATMQALLLGQTLIGQRVLDVRRGLEFLAARDMFDMERVGIVGQSGGGTTAIYSAALLSGIKIAVVSSAFCTFRESLLPRVHCPDNYIPGIMRYCEMGDVLGLFSPRPVVVIGGREDPIFPFAGFERAATQLRRIYAAAGAEEYCRVIATSGGHRFYAREAWEAVLPFLQMRDGHRRGPALARAPSASPRGGEEAPSQ